MTPKEKAKELRDIFGYKAENVCDRLLNTLKRIKSPTLQIAFWQSVKTELETLKN